MRTAGVSAFLSKAARVLAFLALVAYFLLLAHKGFVDIGALRESHPDDFWLALGRHLLRSLGGG